MMEKYDILHRINNIRTVIKAALELIESKKDKYECAGCLEILKVVERAEQKLAELEEAIHHPVKVFKGRDTFV